MLLAAGHKVTGISRSPRGAEWVRRQGASAVVADVLDRDGLHAALRDTAPDAVMHQLTDLAGADGAATDRLRRVGTRNLVDAARSAGATRIVAQSLAFAYAPGEKPASETDPLDVGAAAPRGDLVDGVLALEETASEMDTAVLLRYGVLYGPGTWYSRGGAVAAALAGDADARLLAYLVADSSVTSFVHIADAARVSMTALHWPGGPVNIVDDEPAEGRDWLPVLARALAVPAPAPTPGRLSWARGASNDLARARGWELEYPTWRSGFAALEN
jgi:nucleoside-diphosphate-sugar epimerase